MIKVEINNQTKKRVFFSKIKNAAKAVFRQLKIKKDYYVSVGLVGSNEMKRLNKKYRKKDKITDVLSFEGRADDLGEIIICVSEAKKQAKQKGHSFHCEIQFLFVHGLLHLLGYDHKTMRQKEKMAKVEEKIMKKLC